MTNDELGEAVLKAVETIGQNEVDVSGTQAIPASYEHRDLPRAATMSSEADIAPVEDTGDFLSNRLWMEAGQGSEWAQRRDFYIDAVSSDTAVLPAEWRSSSVELRWPETPGHCNLPGAPRPLRLEARPKRGSRAFVGALIDAWLVEPRLLRNRLDSIIDSRLEPARQRVARQWIIDQERRRRTKS